MTSTAKALTSRPERFDASVDYFHAYWREDNAESFPEAYLMERINGKVKEGFDERFERGEGIHWIGSGGLFLGRRGGERFSRAAGEEAQAAFAEGTRDCSSFSRIDLQARAWYERSQGARAQAQYESHCRLPDKPRQPRKRELFLNNSGGATFALGSRTSDVYLRLYDWGVAHKSASAGCCWRYEAELKGAVATRYGSFLHDGQQTELAIAGLVYSLFTDRRCSMPEIAEAIRLKKRPRVKTDIEGKISWLATQIRPSVLRLIEKGYIEAVIEALGLDDHVTLK